MKYLTTIFFLLLFMRELKLFAEQMINVDAETDVLNFFGIFIAFMGTVISFLAFL